ncbi:OCIA domain-containing protein 1 [Orchesella cincta]|uniref:OCIA domain-containing protein 1 n=1 Tax=Orchesella cincta TaxID=48709 RepID=A0A1D2MSD9_ORCCI|nr:OCIA domain-containing protein 1 [Orchesella cincta]
MSAGGREDYFGGGGGGKADFSSVGGGTPSQGGAGDAAQQQQRYRFNQEEMRAIRECNRESFYYRCLPLGTAMGLSAYYGVRYVLGYFLGKFSYQSVCAEKLMALPNSQLGEVLRKQKGRMGLSETLSLEPGFATPAPVGAPAFSNSDLTQSHSYSDVGDTQPMSGFDNLSSGFSSYDINQQPSSYDTTQQMLDDENLPPKRPQLSTSYDDLRRQNRVEYETKQHSPASTQQNNPGAGGYDGFQSRRSQATQPSYDQGKPRNKYGDVWDDKPASY